MRAGSLTRSTPSSSAPSGPSRRPMPRRKRRREPGVKLPIVPPRKATMRGPAGRGHVAEVALEVADDPVHLQPGVLGGERGAGGADHALGHVDRHVAAQRAGVGERRQQQPALRRGAGAQLDDLGRARQRRDLAGALGEDRPLGAGRVVLGQLADAVEQRGAGRVVEVLGRQLLERPRQAVEHVVGERALVAGAQVGPHGDVTPTLLGVAREPHAGEDLPPLGQVPVAERRRGDPAVRSPTSRRAGRDSASPKKTSEYSRYGWARGSPDSRRRATTSTPTRSRCRRARPPSCAFSHSASVGSRAPAARANASASCQLTWQTGASGWPVAAVERSSRPSALAHASHSRVRHRPARDRERRHVDGVARALVVVGEARPRRRRSRTSPPGSIDPARRTAGRPGGRLARREQARRAPSPGASSRCAAARGGARARPASRRRVPRSASTSSERSRTSLQVARARPPCRAAAGRRGPRAASRTRRTSPRARGAAARGRRAGGKPQVLVGGDVREVPRPAATSAGRARARGRPAPGGRRAPACGGARARARSGRAGERRLRERAWRPTVRARTARLQPPRATLARP